MASRPIGRTPPSAGQVAGSSPAPPGRSWRVAQAAEQPAGRSGFESRPGLSRPGSSMAERPSDLKITGRNPRRGTTRRGPSPAASPGTRSCSSVGKSAGVKTRRPLARNQAGPRCWCAPACWSARGTSRAGVTELVSRPGLARYGAVQPGWPGFDSRCSAGPDDRRARAPGITHPGGRDRPPGPAPRVKQQHGLPCREHR